MSDFVKVANTKDIALGKSKVVDFSGHSVVIFNHQGNFSAIDNICPHKGAPLNEGTFMGTMIMCPWHRWTFETSSGKCITNPGIKISCFEVKVEGEELFLKLQ